MKSQFIAPILLIATGLLFCAEKGVAQGGLYVTNAGNTKFSSDTPLEKIRAENKKVQVILNATTGEMAVRMNMKDFVFPNKLMQEHFNENYIESDKYTTATFSGMVDTSIDYTKNGEYDVSGTGKFTVHGVSKNRTFTGKMKVDNGKIKITSNFQVALTDHKIEVPQIVFVKIAQHIDVNVNFELLVK